MRAKRVAERVGADHHVLVMPVLAERVAVRIAVSR